jgi:hypothetical protein
MMSFFFFFFFGSLRGNRGYLNANNHCQLVFYNSKVPLDFPRCSKYILFIYSQAVYLIALMEATFLLVHINDKGHRHTLKIYGDEFSYHSSSTSQRCNKNPDRQLAANKIRDSRSCNYIMTLCWTFECYVLILPFPNLLNQGA